MTTTFFAPSSTAHSAESLALEVVAQAGAEEVLEAASVRSGLVAEPEMTGMPASW